ncbi:MAG: MBOAT family protein [Firmicutes bacterium]|nr:MBOAT family protein [Bacillota bacterium]
MLFSSITFLYYFLPITLIAYFLTPARYKNSTLLFVSILFYAWGEPKIVFYMLMTIVINYFLGIFIEEKPSFSKLWLTISVVFCLGNLGYFKYADFFIGNINGVTGLSIPLLSVGLPVGISFYTFQILSYTIDVYRGRVRAQKNLIKLATYIAMFPQLIAGPIVRYQDVEGQLDCREYDAEKFAIGIRRFCYGLAKKVLIANILGELCVDFRGAEEASVVFCWMYAVAFALQIYFDFSGYSDMAIGLGKILGFDFMENFNYPFISKSITEFWRRWHISLGSWFRDYVYIPLGGSKKGAVRTYLNILIVWLLTGFWHGAAWNFILWGLYFAILLLIEKKFLLKALEGKALISHIYVLFACAISFVIFNGENLSEILADLGGMLGFGGLPFVTAETIYYLKHYLSILIIAVVGATPLIKNLAIKYEKLKTIEPIVLLGLMVVITAYLIDGSFNPFLYFRF